MKIEMGGMKIEKDGVTIELNAAEVQELRSQLEEIFGLKLKWPDGKSDFGSFKTNFTMTKVSSEP